MEEELNDYRHFYLYAKGWYEETNVIDDLKKIACNYCGAEKIKTSDALNFVIRLAYKAIQHSGNPEYVFEEFMWNVRNGILLQENKSEDERLAYACLELLMFELVSSIDGKLGEPDPKVLPLVKRD
jgi:hypothetical protein